MITNFKFGLLAEYFVMMLYMMRFYSIIAHRNRNFAGEIDIICQRAKSLVFIEVKARSSPFDDVLCTEYQQNRIKRTAEIFLQQHPRYQGFNMRFDLVVIRSYKWPQIIQNAW